MEEYLKERQYQFPTCGKYIVLKSLGEGLTSMIKLAYDKSENKLYAMKVLKSEYKINGGEEFK